MRLGLERPALLDDQLMAPCSQAGAGGEVRIMLPMVATVGSPGPRGPADGSIAHRRPPEDRGLATVAVQLGVMIEVPAAALVADGLAEVADFFSIGTNDLVQYTMAADRTNAAVADLATALQPAVLRLIDGVVRAAVARGRHVAVCGEAAADPVVIPLLVGLGVDGLSVAPGSVGAVRARLAALDSTVCRALATAALAARSVVEVEALVADAIAG